MSIFLKFYELAQKITRGEFLKEVYLTKAAYSLTLTHFKEALTL